MRERRLILLRHAKSSWSDPGLSDFERPLNKRGLRDAPRMGAKLKDTSIKPRLIVSSSAVRARATAETVRAALAPHECALELTERLYLAAPGEMLAVLDDRAADESDVMLVAHNPGITELANRVSDARIDNIPTCGCFVIETGEGIDSWAELRQKPGRLTAYFLARELAAET